jgi:hypothetical protein
MSGKKRMRRYAALLVVMAAAVLTLIFVSRDLGPKNRGEAGDVGNTISPLVKISERLSAVPRSPAMIEQPNSRMRSLLAAGLRPESTSAPSLQPAADWAGTPLGTAGGDAAADSVRQMNPDLVGTPFEAANRAGVANDQENKLN